MSISSDALSAVRRAGQVEHEQLSDRHTLDCGIAFYSTRHPNLPWANQLREVVIPEGKSVEQAFNEVQVFYAGEGLSCHAWVPASTQAPEPLADFLVPRGYRSVCKLTMLLAHQTNLVPMPDVRIVPARAMRKAVAELATLDERYCDTYRESVVQTSLDRLDDPQYDMIIALVNGRAAGQGALFQVGDIARIENVFVLESMRDQGVGTSIMAHLLALTRRLAMRVTCLELLESDGPARRFYERCGFEAGTTYVEFHAPPIAPEAS